MNKIIYSLKIKQAARLKKKIKEREFDFSLSDKELDQAIKDIRRYLDLIDQLRKDELQCKQQI